jgi:hypothetical protein
MESDESKHMIWRDSGKDTRVNSTRHMYSMEDMSSRESGMMREDIDDM